MGQTDCKDTRACRICGETNSPISRALPVCLDCIRTSPRAVESIRMEAHRLSRTPFGLPATVPSDPTGVICTMCVNMCSIPDIASLNTAIPYALLAFSPQFFMNDLPYTPRALADRCLAVTQEAGLERVRIGNVHLLS